MFQRLRLVAPLLAVMVGACGGGGGSSGSVSAPAGDGKIDQPTAIDLYPSQSSAEGARLIVMVTAVGSAAVHMPVIFDTGSAGVTLYAAAIFPASMVSSQGFVFPAGQSSLTYNGITVTDQRGARSYGTTNPRSQNGNIGYAQLTFGDGHGQLTPQLVPIFFYYSITDATTGAALSVPATQGVFGVASSSGSITIAGSSEPAGGYPVCAQGTTGTCLVTSVLKYLQYGSGVTAGFMLTPAPLQSCDIGTAGSCSPAAMLTVGLSSALESGFSTVSLVCPPSGYVGPASIAGYPVCQKNIADASIGVSGVSVGTVTGPVLFDTGTPLVQIASPAGSTFPASVAAGSSVLVSTPSGFAYSYIAANSGDLGTQVNSNPADPSIVGVGYFTTNSLFIDYTMSSEGWK
jgi:hypothetical protein